MSNRLLLLIDENWPQSPAAPWVLLDDANRPLSEGRSEPRHWPAADRCEVILGGAQCVWHQARLPKGARRDEARLLGYALEDRLLREPDSQHLTVIARDAADDGVVASVLVVARDRLRALLAQLEAIGRSPAAVHAEIETAPASEGNWCLSSRDSMLLLRRAGAGEVIDGPLHEALPIIEHALAVARAANRSPTALVLHMPPGTEHVESDHDTALPGTTIRSGPPYLWWQSATAAHNLLHDEFASRAGGGTLLSGLRKPALLAAIAATVLLGASLAEVMWKKSRLSGIEERMRRIFSTAMPNTPAIAPAAQLNRQLNLKRSENGRLRDDDLLALLAIYGEARGVEARSSVTTLRYNDHKLELTLPALDAQQRAVLAERLASRGLRPAFLEGKALRLILSREVAR
ncbi:MAG: hypothetical protein H6950_06620 [Zoogloeaceae bacterium]|nr:hypothetical protein [Zoogloeaceae bacterium]MCP5294370.1 hypothetical protein [Zoogloeaceae bacterium]